MGRNFTSSRRFRLIIKIHTTTDLDITKVSLILQGVPKEYTSHALVHRGFLRAYNSVSITIINTISSQLHQHPSYSIVSTGFSLGAALASICGVALGLRFPITPLRTFTFGQPRTGDGRYVDLVEHVIGKENIYRGECALIITHKYKLIIPHYSHTYVRYILSVLRIRP